MDREYIMTETALVLTVLESTLRFLESGQGVLTESFSRIDEGKLQDIQKSVRAVIDLMRSNPEEFDDKMNELIEKGYGKALNAIGDVLARHGITADRIGSLIQNGYDGTLSTVKDILARHGITATRHHPLTGYPAIERTSVYNDELDRDRTLKAIQKLVMSRTHQFDDNFENNQKHSRLFVPKKLDGRYGYECKVVGSLADDIEGLDGDGLTVTLTDNHRYGFDDAPFYEKTYFITLSQAQTA